MSIPTSNNKSAISKRNMFKQSKGETPSMSAIGATIGNNLVKKVKLKK